MNADARGRVLVASNRGPVSFRLSDDGKLTSRRGGGGMVSGLSSVAGQAEVLWVCAALSDADRTAARAAPGGYLDTPDASLDGAGSAVRMLDIPPATFERAYNGVANSTLWFVHHMLYDTPNRPQFGLAFRRDWAAYRDYNTAFAEALAAAEEPGRSRTSRTRRGRPSTTSGCCLIMSPRRCSTGFSAPTTPASSAAAGPTHSST